jgi:hypothetical protein
MKILVDMNLSPDWVPVLKDAGVEGVHWSQVGNPSASDQVVMDHARVMDMWYSHMIWISGQSWRLFVLLLPVSFRFVHRM